MAGVSYTIAGSAALCPHCRHTRFTGPKTVEAGDRVVCANCRQVVVVDPEAPGGLRAVGAKKFQPPEPNLRRREGAS
ncbi:MAG TPA: hypothetical protein VMC10_01130 [Stellaceae bacterium]|nr:hypothetical protein [Stellaceae bacterium]